MADVTTQDTLSEELEIVKQNQHGDIDPTGTRLRQNVNDIWRRLRAQPSTYMLTKEELAVFNYYRDEFADDGIAQQAVRRFWGQHLAKQIDIEATNESKEPHGKTKSSSPQESDPMTTPSQQDHTQSQNPSKDRVAYACQYCRSRRMKCSRESPACQTCQDLGRLCVYWNEEQKKFAVNLSKEDETYNTRRERERSRAEMRKITQGEQSQNPRNSLSKRQDEPTPQIWDLDPERLKFPETPKRQDESTRPTWKADPGHLKSVESVMSRLCVHVSNGEEYSFVNSMKLWVQSLTGEAWDWWPLRPSSRRLVEDEVRIRWHCESGHAHWTVLSKTGLALSLEALKGDATTQSAPSGSKKPESTTERSSSTNTRTGRSSGSDLSVETSSPATSEIGSSDQSDDEAGSGKKTNPSSAGTAVDIVPPSKLTGFVLFGVYGSKRLQSACLRLAQIDVVVHNDDDSFFDEMVVQYQKLRGFFRRVFSIWVFHTCDFIMLHKANPNEIMAGPKEMPSPRDRDYAYTAGRNPPILSTVFNANFHGCKKACIKSQLDLLCLFHQCKGRNHCGKYRVLERLPKRRRKWDIDRDEEGEEAWGLNAVFGVSFYKVTLYHVLIVTGPILFWGLWLKKWPADWQNASVPFFAVMVLFSLFWLPLSHKTSPAKGGRSSKNKSI